MVVSVRMGWREGLEVLKDLGVRPDALYWEGYPLTTTEVEELLQHCQRTFRGVTVVGDGWSHPEVREGVLKSRELFGHRPFVELGKCWTYARIKEHELSEPREIYYHQTENKAGQVSQLTHHPPTAAAVRSREGGREGGTHGCRYGYAARGSLCWLWRRWWRSRTRRARRW